MAALVQDIRDQFVEQYEQWSTTRDDRSTLEIVGASFVADDQTIFGDVNEDYVTRELDWYVSQSLNVNDIAGNTPKIWRNVATEDGRINSNYGHLFYSDENGTQYWNVVNELHENPQSRRALAIYTRPSMHIDATVDGMQDFVCTNAVQYLVRGGKLNAVVQMRSNDAWAGYRNDRAWQKYALEDVARALDIETGVIVWQVGSLHLYRRQFYLVHHYIETGELSITKEEFRSEYPDVAL